MSSGNNQLFFDLTGRYPSLNESRVINSTFQVTGADKTGRSTFKMLDLLKEFHEVMKSRRDILPDEMSSKAPVLNSSEECQESDGTTILDENQVALKCPAGILHVVRARMLFNAGNEELQLAENIINRLFQNKVSEENCQKLIEPVTKVLKDTKPENLAHLFQALANLIDRKIDSRMFMEIVEKVKNDTLININHDQ